MATTASFKPFSRDTAHASIAERSPSAFEVDENGSPVTLEEADWLVCFVPGLKRQWWHRFVSGYQHVFAIRCVGKDRWLLFEPWWSRLLVSTLTTEQALEFLRWAHQGSVLKVRERIPGHGGQFRGWSNCAVLTAFLLGRDYHVYSPNRLRERLLGEPDVREVRIADVLASHYASLIDGEVHRAFDPVASLASMGHVDGRMQLVFLAGRVLSALARPRVAMAYRLARSESATFPELSDTLSRCGTSRAVDLASHALTLLYRERDAASVDRRAMANAFIDHLRSARDTGAAQVDHDGCAALVDAFLRRMDIVPIAG